MKRLLPLIAFVTSVSFAQAQSFIAMLDGAQDGGGDRMGSGIFNITLTGTTLSLSGSFSGLGGIFANAHIHGPSAAGTPSGVLYGIVPLIALDAGNRSGTIIPNATISLMDNPNGTSFSVAQQLAQLNGGLWYFNIHSSANQPISPGFPGGEIRGQILLVPEPSTLALAALGLGGLVIWRVRRRAV